MSPNESRDEAVHTDSDCPEENADNYNVTPVSKRLQAKKQTVDLWPITMMLACVRSPSKTVMSRFAKRGASRRNGFFSFLSAGVPTSTPVGLEPLAAYCLFVYLFIRP